MRPLILGLAMAALASCASVTSPSTTPTGIGRPTGSVDFGDFRRGAPDAVSRRFGTEIASRYASGAALSAVQSDLVRNGFQCRDAAPGGRGDPPDRVCRRSVSDSGCTHTWQVLLYDDRAAANLTRTRGTYDRACGGDDGLLGGR